MEIKLELKTNSKKSKKKPNLTVGEKLFFHRLIILILCIVFVCYWVFTQIATPKIEDDLIITGYCSNITNDSITINGVTINGFIFGFGEHEQVFENKYIEFHAHKPLDDMDMWIWTQIGEVT